MGWYLNWSRFEVKRFDLSFRLFRLSIEFSLLVLVSADFICITLSLYVIPERASLLLLALSSIHACEPITAYSGGQ